jgi:UDP-N-acetyl-D-glucosamine dehydrogenase
MNASGANVTVVDPHVPTFRLDGKTVETYSLTPELLQNADLVLLTTDHTAFDYEMIAQNSDVLFDTRNAMKDVENKPARYVKL